MSNPKSFPGLQEFLFGAPLYDEYVLPEGKWYNGDNLRGHCPFCNNDSIFKTVWKPSPPNIAPPIKMPSLFEMSCRCAVDADKHQLRFILMLSEDLVQKIGQLPSFATIAQGDGKSLRKLLSKEDGAELFKAIGLAAHGVGIGSLVYMRRIFERLIRSRFNEFKDQEGWNENEFQTIRMEEKINLLKDHLPDFLVRNRKLYGILSFGIHELNEEDCLSFFEIAHSSIRFILDDDRRKKEELAERASAERAIANYSGPRGRADG